MTRSPEDFLARHGWAAAKRHWLAQDLSRRRYARITAEDGRTRLLMDAPPNAEDVRPFMAVASHLRDMGLSVPEIEAADPAQGYLLVEDFGDDTFTRILDQTPERAQNLYRAALSILAHLHRHPAPDRIGNYAIPVFDADEIRRQLRLFGEWYPPAIGGIADPESICDLFEPLIPTMLCEQPVLVLRDFHVDNLMILEERPGIARVGLLDFQDAMVGHPAYDVLSLLQDARRDVANEQALLQTYVQESGMAGSAFLAAYRRFGILRHLRVLGVFVRAWIQRGRTDKLVHLPRLWRMLEQDLDAIGATALQRRLHDLVPPDKRIIEPL